MNGKLNLAKIVDGPLKFPLHARFDEILAYACSWRLEYLITNKVAVTSSCPFQI